VKTTSGTIDDTWSRMVVGQAITDHQRSTGVIEAPQIAPSRHRVESGLIFYPDHGVQDTDGRVRIMPQAHLMRHHSSPVVFEHLILAKCAVCETGVTP
jgi:hypothetical protein